MVTKSPKIEQAYDGEWLRPVRRGYLLKCCKCGLKHRINFRLVKKGKKTFIEYQPFRI